MEISISKAAPEFNRRIVEVYGNRPFPSTVKLNIQILDEFSRALGVVNNSIEHLKWNADFDGQREAFEIIGLA